MRCSDSRDLGNPEKDSPEAKVWRIAKPSVWAHASQLLPAIARWLQSWRLVGRVAELVSLGRTPRMGWFTRKQQTQNELQADRYAGRPLLILLDNYVLSCIDQLPADKEAGLLSVTQRVYGGGDDWKATLRATLQLGDSLDESLRNRTSRSRQRILRA
jgi:hypothetical protein